MSALLTLKGNTVKDCVKEFSKLKVNGKIIPILEYVLFDNQLATVTNLEESIDYKLPEKESEPFLVPIKQFKKISKKVKNDDDIVFGYDNEKNKVYLVINGKQKFTFDSLPVEDFPKRPIDNLKSEGKKEERLFYLGPDEIEVIKKANKFVSKDDLRPALCGVCLFKNKVVSTDGNILFWQYLDELKGNENKYILPSNFVNLLNKDSNIVKRIGDFNLVFEDTSTIKTCRVIDESYHDVDVVGNFESVNTILLNKKELQQCIENIKIQEGAKVNIEVKSKDEVNISSNNGDLGQGYEEPLNAKCWVEKNDYIGFIIKPFELIIKEIDEDEIELGFNENWNNTVVKVNSNFIVMSKLKKDDE